MTEIPGYTLMRKLGQGGMGEVYLAVQQSLGREVALKLLAPSLSHDPAARERFVREARIAANLHHPHIVPIHDVGVHEGTAYIAMEYESGGTVAPLARGPADPAVALAIVRDVARALDHAHRNGVIHRDVKPENVLRRPDGHCLLSDFGIARALEAPTILTHEGASVGTPQYMSPEQLRGQDIDGRSDLYSLGVVLYQLLTGALPYSGSDSYVLGMQHINAPIPRLPPELAHLQGLIDSLMAKDPAARPQTGAEVVGRIDALLAGVAAPITIPLAAASSTTPRRVARAWMIGAVVAALALGYLGFDRLVLAPRRELAQSGVASHAATAAPVTAGEQSIAVMPFADLSPSGDQGYFSEGISEQLLSMLAQVPGLHVAGRTSTLSFKGKNASAAEIGKALKVNTLLEGSVRKAGERLRVTVDLVNAADGLALWSQTYDRELTDIFAVQDDIAGAVVDALRIKLLPALRPSTRKHHVPSFETYDKYLFSLQALKRQGGVDSAVAALREAVALDPQYAEGYAALAMSESFAAEGDPVPARAAEGYRRALDAAEQAVKLDAELGDAYGARGYVRSTDYWDWDNALSDLEKAVSIEPGQARNQLRYGYLLATLGRLPEAITALQKGVEVDPLFTPCWYWLGRIKAARGDFEGARLALKRALAIDPGYVVATRYLGMLSLLQGDAAAARAVFAEQKLPIGLALAEHDLGHAAEAQRAQEQFIAEHARDQAFRIACVYAWWGEREQAFAWLDRAVEQHDAEIQYLKFDPLLRGLRDDTRYAALLERLKLPKH